MKLYDRCVLQGTYILENKNLINEIDNEPIDGEYFIDTFINEFKKFEILSEEDEEIDIDSIEEFELEFLIRDEDSYKIRCKINKLIKAVKLLNKKIKE